MGRFSCQVGPHISLNESGKQIHIWFGSIQCSIDLTTHSLRFTEIHMNRQAQRKALYLSIDRVHPSLFCTWSIRIQFTIFKFSSNLSNERKREFSGTSPDFRCDNFVRCLEVSRSTVDMISFIRKQWSPQCLVNNTKHRLPPKLCESLSLTAYTDTFTPKITSCASVNHVSLTFYLPFVSFFALMNAHFPCEWNQLVDK